MEVLRDAFGLASSLSWTFQMRHHRAHIKELCPRVHDVDPLTDEQTVVWSGGPSREVLRHLGLGHMGPILLTCVQLLRQLIDNMGRNEHPRCRVERFSSVGSTRLCLKTRTSSCAGTKRDWRHQTPEGLGPFT